MCVVLLYRFTLGHLVHKWQRRGELKGATHQHPSASAGRLVLIRPPLFSVTAVEAKVTNPTD